MSRKNSRQGGQGRLLGGGDIGSESIPGAKSPEVGISQSAQVVVMSTRGRVASSEKGEIGPDRSQRPIGCDFLVGVIGSF